MLELIVCAGTVARHESFYEGLRFRSDIMELDATVGWILVSLELLECFETDGNPMRLLWMQRRKVAVQLVGAVEEYVKGLLVTLYEARNNCWGQEEVEEKYSIRQRTVRHGRECWVCPCGP